MVPLMQPLDLGDHLLGSSIDRGGQRRAAASCSFLVMSPHPKFLDPGTLQAD